MALVKMKVKVRKRILSGDMWSGKEENNQLL